ncbi:hypothetical protein O181_130527 [Austropuccinia psidii MF-1]|uniref:Reverse transcriptase RNase H-like domain-containing protein n=1 Tax=Austropuccinia psidii MF-1 TaxID=1389203 RepID=A0A9Q3QCK0_9BASI|nr:hypothetical protein [Austropuccinia psidii MF-1]
MECLLLVWALEKSNYFFEECAFKVITDCTAVKSLLNMKTPNRLSQGLLDRNTRVAWHSAIWELTWKTPKNADGLSRCPLPNNIDNPAYVPEEASPQVQ